MFAGTPLKAGKYRMYAVPGEKTWQVILNGELGKSGSEMPDHAMDVLTVEVESSDVQEEAEQFIIYFEETGPGLNLNFKWDHKLVSVPIGEAAG